MRQYRIGLMAVHSAIDYPHALRKGVQNVIEEAGHTLVTIAELIPYHTLAHAQEYLRVATEIARQLDLDAVIFPAGCMTAYLSGDGAAALELLKLMDPAKTLVLEREVPGYRCISKDNAPGMHECMKHLIEDCGFTKIAFISGPEGSKGAHERETIYFEEMAAHGLKTDPSLFGRGFFSGDCAAAAEAILDANPDVQAIACACDLMAYTVYSILHKRGIAVGEDIAVTGFDDHPRSAHMDPPLSTVRMTSYDYGRMAAREALRMCEQLPPKETVLSSAFIARGSCGENIRNKVDRLRELLRQKPFPASTFVDIMMESTLSMASPHITEDFRAHMESFFEKVRAGYLKHVEDPHPDDLLFSSQDLAALFGQDYRKGLSLEGFHSVAINLLEALLEESHENEANWVIGQISHLHLRVARLLSTATQEDRLESNKREWITFHTVDDALREDENPARAYELMLGEFNRMGMRYADLFLLPEPVSFIGSRHFAMSDSLLPVGRLTEGHIEVKAGQQPLVMQEFLAHVLERYDNTTECIVGGLLAGNELLGIAAINGGDMSDHDQLMIFMNLGIAFKHLNMIGTMREMNDLLSKNNLLLKQESQHDEMTGLLNRRGFISQVKHLIDSGTGTRAAIMYLDLDGLKTINDTLGHDMGDAAIKQTARILKQHISGENTLCRLGGDEFIALVFVEDQQEADALIAKVQASMDEFNRTHDLPYALSISGGAALFDVSETPFEDIPQIMVQADERLYTMKRTRKHSRRFEG